VHEQALQEFAQALKEKPKDEMASVRDRRQSARALRECEQEQQEDLSVKELRVLWKEC